MKKKISSTIYLSKFIALIFMLPLMSCTIFRTYSPDELATSDNFYKSVVLNTTIKDIEERYKLSKGQGFPTKIYISQRKARIIWTIYNPGRIDGLAINEVMALIDFEQPDLKNPKVIAKSYTYNSFWQEAPDEFLGEIEYEITD